MIPKTASERVSAFDHVVSARGHSFPVDGCSEGGNVWVMNISRPGLYTRSESVVQWVCVWREWLPHSLTRRNFTIAGNFALLDVCAGAIILLKHNSYREHVEVVFDSGNKLSANVVLSLFQSVYTQTGTRLEKLLRCNPKRHYGC